MILTVQEIVEILRSSVNVQYEESGVTDSAYLTMTDEDLLLFVKLGCSRAYPEVSSLDDLEDGSEYPIVLLSKIELYTKLAVLKADKVDLTADNNNQLKQSQRFTHYMALVAEAREQYTSWLENEGQGKVQSYDLLLSNRHHTRRNYELTPTPKVKLDFGTISNDSVEIGWSVSNTSRFGRYKVYLSTSPIVDMYKDGSKIEDKINSEATLVKSTNDIRDNHHRVSGLTPSTTYHVAVVSVERNSVFGYTEKTFTTLEEFVEEEEVSVDSI